MTLAGVVGGAHDGGRGDRDLDGEKKSEDGHEDRAQAKAAEERDGSDARGEEWDEDEVHEEE